MAMTRSSMRQVKEILRQKWELGRTHREVMECVGVSVGGVSSVLSRAAAAGITWAEAETMAEDVLEGRLYGPRREEAVRAARALPDPAWIHTERSRPGVTLELLHVEYLERDPTGYRYTQFCEYYRQWLKRRRLSMRQVHRAGEKLFVDYSGKKPHIVDRATGELIEVELFVAVLGASNYTYAEATRTQQLHNWIASHARAFEFLGGVPRDTVPDQLRSGVSAPCRYEPGIQRSYEEMAQHYGTTVLPARPGKPRDKAKVEVAVQIVQRWILARLRNRVFFSLEELNLAIAELVAELNERTMRRYQASRRELFERLDRPALRPLPASRFECGEWSSGGVNIDYHVEFDGHYYSVPYTLVQPHEQTRVELRVTATTVEILLRGARITSHLRSRERGRHTTKPEHMPKAHREHMEWSPSRFIQWAGKIGPETAKLVEVILQERRHPEQGYRSCLGILRLSKRYGDERLELACERAFAVGARSYRHVDAILKKGLDRLPALPAPDTKDIRPTHGNVRGRGYYH